MTPLEAAREILHTDVTDNFDKECPFCGMNPNLHGVEGWKYAADPNGALHYPECPWLQIGAIVAALEAAQAAVAEHGKPAGHIYVICHHSTTQQGGNGCHRFASCHALWPERCEYMPHEHYQQGSSLLALNAALSDPAPVA